MFQHFIQTFFAVVNSLIYRFSVYVITHLAPSHFMSVINKRHAYTKRMGDNEDSIHDSPAGNTSSMEDNEITHQKIPTDTSLKHTAKTVPFHKTFKFNPITIRECEDLVRASPDVPNVQIKDKNNSQ